MAPDKKSQDGARSVTELCSSQLAGLLALSADWVWATDKAGETTSILATNGDKPARRLVRAFSDLLSQSDSLKKALAPELPFSDVRVPAPDGRGELSFSGTPIFSDDDDFVGFQGIAFSVAKENTSASPAAGTINDNIQRGFPDRDDYIRRFEAALNTMDAGFMLWDREDRLVFANDAIRQVAGGLEHVFPGQTYREFLKFYAYSGWAPGLAGIEERWIENAIATRNDPKNEPVEIVNRDGQIYQIRQHTMDNGDRVEFLIDVTTLRNALSETSHARQKLEMVLNTIPAQVIMYDKDDRFVFANAKALKAEPELDDIRIKGATLKEVVRAAVEQKLFDYVDNEEQNRLLHEDPDGFIDATLDRWSRPLSETTVRRLKDGRWLENSYFRHEDGTFIGVRFDITEQKNAELRLQAVHEQLESIVESMPASVVVYDENNRYVMANGMVNDLMPELREFHSKPGGSLRESFQLGREHGYFRHTGNDEIDAIYEGDEDVWLDAMERFYDEPERVDERQMPDGRWFKAFNRRLPNGFFVGIRVDITEQKEAEFKSEAMRMRLASVLDSLHVDVLIYDENNNLLLINKRMRQKIAEGIHEPGQTLRDTLRIGYRNGLYRYVQDDRINALYDQDEEAWIDAMEQYYDQPYRCYERRRKDGSWYRAIDVRTNDGLLVMIRVDLSKEKQIQDDLEQSLKEIELFREIVDNVPVAIYTKDPEGHLTYANKSWGRMSRCDRHEAIGKTDVELFGESGKVFAENDAFVMREFEAGRSSQGIEIAETRMLPDGSVQYQHSSKSRLDLDGKPVLLGSTIDVTEAREREAELAEARQQAELADRAKSEFLANMSHEIRTPMNGVLGMAELLSGTELSGKQRTFTDVILKSGNALLTIINDILDFSKIDAGQLVLKPDAFDLEEAIQDVATLMSVRAKEKDLELIVRYAPDLPTQIIGDVGRIRQIVTNLVGNAVKFTEEGHVLVDVSGSTASDEVSLTIRVQDTGIGIPTDKLQSVFDKFSQVDTSSTRRHEGTGLGLAITARLIELMDGSIGVESSFGEGATFSLKLTLPLAENQLPEKVVHTDVTGARILIIDDNSINRSILLEQMAAWKFDACAATSGSEGMAILEAAKQAGMPVDCLILDYQMPVMNGEEVARAIRSNPAFGDLAIVMLTSVDHAINKSKCNEIGVDGYLIKPARSSTLLDAIVSVLHARRSSGDENTFKGVRVFQTTEAAAIAAASGNISAARTLMGDGEPTGIPLPEETEENESSLAQSPASDSGGLDLLIAEDNEVNQMVMEQILEDLPYSYEVVENGELAVEAFLDKRPRLILMDVSMPKMNGLEATAHIRRIEKKHELAATPVIAVTAHALKGDRERCLESGMDDYLAKPINHSALRDMLERYFGSKSKTELRKSA
ncbi:response regulator [Notoacmeibacter sp. MSK16QG-6]|uniref:response regulator n=1 Tax=Notoacmeibacter sp. MSK16QG-6 TaxID=2957982 RepID=UPI00209F21AF|nr:response regulator [Notoacmeibacter sp. MSK16QG-6]MCP1200038.1 response regulator [Notoacmeibacter sp. MSK16QG-6]